MENETKQTEVTETTETVEFTEEQQEHINRLVAQAKSKAKDEVEKTYLPQIKSLEELVAKIQSETEAERYEKLNEDEKLTELEQKLAEYEAKENFNNMLSVAKTEFNETELEGKNYITDEVLKPFVDSNSAENTKKAINSFVEFLAKRDEEIIKEVFKGQTPATQSASNHVDKNKPDPHAERRNKQANPTANIPSNWD